MLAAAKMTRAQALREARKRWGSEGGIKDAGKPSTMIAKGGLMKGQEVVVCGRYRVGRQTEIGWFAVEGHGDSWEAAFADVDRRQARYRAP